MQITARKDVLLKTLRENREEHRAVFERALEVYREKWIELLEAKIESAKRGDRISQTFRIPVPEDHTDDFDNAITMLEWHTGDEITLDDWQVATWIRNEWGWQQSFAANTGSYLAGS